MHISGLIWRQDALYDRLARVLKTAAEDSSERKPKLTF